MVFVPMLSLGRDFGNIQLALDSVTNESVVNFFCKARNYMFGYLEGFTAGPDLEKLIKKCKKEYKSYRRVGVNDWYSSTELLLLYIVVKINDSL